MASPTPHILRCRADGCKFATYLPARAHEHTEAHGVEHFCEEKKYIHHMLRKRTQHADAIWLGKLTKAKERVSESSIGFIPLNPMKSCAAAWLEEAREGLDRAREAGLGDVDYTTNGALIGFFEEVSKNGHYHGGDLALTQRLTVAIIRSLGRELETMALLAEKTTGTVFSPNHRNEIAALAVAGALRMFEEARRINAASAAAGGASFIGLI